MRGRFWHTESRYESADLDFVTPALLEDLDPELAPLGFVHTGRLLLSVFEHPDTDWHLGFPPALLAFGGYYTDVSQCTVHHNAAVLRRRPLKLTLPNRHRRHL